MIVLINMTLQSAFQRPGKMWQLNAKWIPQPPHKETGRNMGTRSCKAI